MAKTIYAHFPRAVKKCRLDPRTLLSVLIRHFPIALYNGFSFCNIVCGSLINSNSQKIYLVMSSIKNNIHTLELGGGGVG